MVRPEKNIGVPKERASSTLTRGPASPFIPTAFPPAFSYEMQT